MSWFLFDLIVVFPFQWVIVESDSNQLNGLLRILRLPRIYRIFRIGKIIKMCRDMENINPLLERFMFKMVVNAGILRLISTLVSVILFIHLFSCLWFFVAKFSDFPPESW